MNRFIMRINMDNKEQLRKCLEGTGDGPVDIIWGPVDLAVDDIVSPLLSKLDQYTNPISRDVIVNVYFDDSLVKQKKFGVYGYFEYNGFPWVVAEDTQFPTFGLSVAETIQLIKDSLKRLTVNTRFNFSE